MKIEILFFGQLTDITRCQSLSLDHVPDSDILQNILLEQYPELKHAKFTIAINNKIIRGKTEISPMCKIAIMPPFSGG